MGVLGAGGGAKGCGEERTDGAKAQPPRLETGKTADEAVIRFCFQACAFASLSPRLN